MKRIKSIFAIAVIAILGFACQKEEVGPIPGAIEKEVKAGEKPTISFSVNGSWSISSDQVWCQFATSGGYLQEMAGGSGVHTITLNITDENNGNQWSTANITMKKDGKKGIIATIKRHPKELYIKLYDITDTPIKVFKLGYVDWTPTRIDGNFRYAATDIPDWVEVAVKHENGTIEITNAISGVPGEQIEVLLRIVNDGEREKNEIKEDDGHKIVLSDENGEHTFEFPITYAGMGTDKLTYIGPTEYYYGWEVSLDGKNFRQTDPVSGATVTFSDKLEYTITAQNATAVEIVEKYGFEVNDLYAVSLNLPPEAHSDAVHYYTSIGTKAFTDSTVSHIVSALGITDDLNYQENLYTDAPIGF